MRRLAIALGLAGLLLAALPASAGAHAALETSSPGWGTVLRSAPRALRLAYDEEVVPRYARVTVSGPHDGNLAGAPVVTGTVVTVPLRGARTGSYTVRWHMVASDDGHATEGAFSYGIRVRPLPPAPASGLDVPVAPQLLAWLQFLGIVLAGGMLTFRALIWIPSRRTLERGSAPDAGAAIGLGVIGAVLGLHSGLLAFLTGAYPIVGGGVANFVNTEITPIRVGTHPGQAWTVMTFAWLAVLMLLVAAWATPAKRERLLASAGVLTLSMAVGLSWASHPASRGNLALIADYVHLVAGALWVGGLVALLLAARAVCSLPRPEREAVTRRSVLRFSALALPAVALVALAGVYLAVRQLPAPSALLSSGYGVTLLVKAAVALAALALGGYHRRVVIPRLAGGAPVATLRRTLSLELGVLLAVLVLAAVLSQSAPPG
jgi:copper transport protein